MTCMDAPFAELKSYFICQYTGRSHVHVLTCKINIGTFGQEYQLPDNVLFLNPGLIHWIYSVETVKLLTHWNCTNNLQIC